VDVKKLQRGDLVVAVQDLDPEGARVAKGTLGVVFEEAGFYGDEFGPMVRWFTGGACNVYTDDVVAPDEYDDEIDSLATMKTDKEVH